MDISEQIGLLILSAVIANIIMGTKLPPLETLRVRKVRIGVIRSTIWTNVVSYTSLIFVALIR